jgi:hypothetical protein
MFENILPCDTTKVYVNNVIQEVVGIRDAPLLNDSTEEFSIILHLHKGIVDIFHRDFSKPQRGKSLANFGFWRVPVITVTIYLYVQFSVPTSVPNRSNVDTTNHFYGIGRGNNII